MPESTVPEQQTPEVVQTPRQRVEEFFRERGQTANELNRVNDPGSSKWGWEWTPERLAEAKRLELQLGDQRRRFREEIVSNEPEAQAWVEIEKENYQREIGCRTEQALYGSIPTDKEYGKLMMQIARASYNEAVENLKMVHERTLGAGATPK